MAGEETAVRKDQAVEPSVHLIVFRLGEEEFGIRIEQVKEVTITPEIARMPKTPEFIRGVANVRGDIIAIMNLEDRFSIRRQGYESNTSLIGTYTLVIEAKDYIIGLVVREMPQSVSLPASSIDRTPTFIQELNIHQNYIEGLGKIGNRLIILLDMGKILSQQEAETLIASGQTGPEVTNS
jgi:purine-binding chemotaxis protein CheW